MSIFAIHGRDFVLDGAPFKLISGAMHYFRVPRDYWRDRLEKIKLMGCNTVETYVPWVLHEPRKGTFNFTEELDLVGFLREIEQLGLYAIVRPSPYICAEFEFGGLPWWLLTDRNMRVRSMHPQFVQAVDEYYDELIPLLVPLQAQHGGPVLLFQVENEHGYWSSSGEYPRRLAQALRSRGIVQPLCTSDGPWGECLRFGKIDGALQTANFGSQADLHFDKLQQIQPEAPLVCMEYWVGWFDAWGDDHHVRDADDAAATLDAILQRGHVNIYMAHGGSNFGFTSGANYRETYQPDVTSYDYDAPIAEDGTLTSSFYAFQSVIKRHRTVPNGPLSTQIDRLPPMELSVQERVPLLPNVHAMVEPITHNSARSMEELGQGFGYVLYRLEVPVTDVPIDIDVRTCADRVHVFCDGVHVQTREWNEREAAVPLPPQNSAGVIDVLVENQGRVNFGPRMGEQRKGCSEGIRIAGVEIGPVTHYRLPLDTVPSCTAAPKESPDSLRPAVPAFFSFTFDLQLPTDRFLDAFVDTAGWGKGVVFVNGRNIGRFWDRGPQRTLYLPGTLLRDGHNSLVVFETEGRSSDSIRLVDSPNLGDRTTEN